MLKTYSVKIKIPKERKNDLFSLFNMVSEIYNHHIEWALENKSYRKDKAHHALYYQLRKEYPTLPCQYIQSTRDNALENIKRDKFKTKPIRKSTSIRLVKGCTITFNQNTGNTTFSCIGKRIKIQVPVDNQYYINNFQNLKFQSAILKYNRQDKSFRLNLIFKNDNVKEFEGNIIQSKVIGIDLGIHNIITLSDGTIIKGNNRKRIKRKYQYLRRKLQVKGTSSAKRLLKKISGKEARFSQNENHILSKFLVNLDYDVIVFENLRNIRKKKSYSKKCNRMISNWTFGQLIEFTKYKAIQSNQKVVQIDPRYTSQKCSMCNYIDKSNRYHSKFKCKKCGFQKHSDINAAINIKNNFLSFSLKTDKQGTVNCPYESNTCYSDSNLGACHQGS